MNLRILIIEDDPENREGLRILISRYSPRSQVFYAAIWIYPARQPRRPRRPGRLPPPEGFPKRA